MNNQQKVIRKVVLLCLLGLFVIMAFSSCRKTPDHKKDATSEPDNLEITLESWESDIDFLIDVMDITRGTRDHLDVLIVFVETPDYVPFWYGQHYSINGLKDGKPVQMSDGHEFEDGQYFPDYNFTYPEGYAIKRFYLADFDFQESGDYIIHNDFRIDPNEKIGILDLKVHVTIPDKTK